MNCVHRLALAIIVSFSPRAFAGEAAGVLKEPFKVLFEVVNKGKNGSFVMEVIPSWAPFAAERMREMIDHRFFDHSKFFHVIPDFMVHMGIHQDRFENDRWDRMRIPDDSRENAVKNTMGTVAFITKGRNSRTTHMFINLRDNPPLDGSDLMPFARIVEGMETVREINGEYEERPDMFKAKEIGNEYLEKNFPRLSSIVRARYVQDDEEDTNDEL